MVCEKERVKFLAVVILVLLIVRLKWQQFFCIPMKEMSLGHIMSRHGLFIFASLFYFLQICDKI